MLTINFTVPGTPIPKGRPRLGKHGTFTPPKTKLYERKVAYQARAAMAGISPTKKWVNVQVTFYMPIPKSFSKKQKEDALSNIRRPIGKEDSDNLLKSILDGQNGITYIDDNQVCDISASKYYDINPRAEVKVSWNE